MHKIEAIKSREILDSRGIPTVEVDVFLTGGAWGRAAVPSGASTGSHEAIERRDNDPARYRGKGVACAVADVVQKIFPAVKGQDIGNQRQIDNIMCELDGTPNKAKLGANAILAVSLACARANANANKLPLYRALGEGCTLPMPLVNVLNGGAHADNDIDIQEFMIVPTGARCFSEAIRMCSEVFHSLKSLLKKMGYNTNVGDEGGVAPNLKSSEDAFDVLMEAINDAGYSDGVKLALDVASSELFDGEMYKIDGNARSSDGMIEYYERLVKKYPIISIEDGLGEDDWLGWTKMTQRLSDTQIVGDDLFVTNTERVNKGIAEGAANAVLIKLNQIGTLTETLDVIRMAKSHGWKVVISHRSGETDDTFIADFAVAVDAGQIKTGSTSRGERLAKYNQLIRIEEELGAKAAFAHM
ncbi:MAG: phosphopyruvate hydratase [Holosporales bacterium]|jgi:enolase|nr:phosphopyruvate hydratase [Holosporales bacterium]